MCMCVCVCGRHRIKERKNKKKCCLAKGVDVIKTAATNCSFVLRGGVNFGRVFSVSLTRTHTHTYTLVCCTRLAHNGPRGRYTGVTRRRKEAARGPPGQCVRVRVHFHVCMYVCVYAADQTDCDITIIVTRSERREHNIHTYTHTYTLTKHIRDIETNDSVQE